MTDDLLPRLAARLRATPAELAGLVVLLVGVLALAIVATRPAGPPATSVVSTGGSVLDPAPAEAEVTVHVAGAVTAPGVLTLPPGSRVADAVLAAGGLTRDADAAALNLARLLEDGEQILVPVAGAATTGNAPGVEGAVDGDGRVDLNAATAAELEELPGVGPVLASRIVAFREEHGPFVEVGQLREVAGIGERKFQSLADLIVVR